MEKTEEIILEEARRHSESFSNGISRTRSKSWQLVALFAALETFLIDRLTDHFSIYTQIVWIASIPFGIYMIYYLFPSLLPTKMPDNGADPRTLIPISKEGEEYFIECMLHTYETSIDKNKKVLEKMVVAYKKALKAMVVFGLAAMLFSLLFFLFLFERL
jgi:hypothetical protein